MDPVDRMLSRIERRGLEESLRISVVTDISLPSLVQGSTELTALIRLMERVRQVSLRYLPRIHAKVYVAGESLAIITSANFTNGGAFTNFEYGVVLDEPDMVRNIARDIERYAFLGGTVSLQRLQELNSQVTELRTAVREEQSSINAKVKGLAAALAREAEDQLLRGRVAGRSVFGVFADTILYLLESGPLATSDLHERIRAIHPDLCDDSLDRIIDGEHFGKLWKHKVRTAQQHLKRTGHVEYDSRRRVWLRISS